MRYQDDIITGHNMKTVCRAAVTKLTKRLTTNEQTRVQIWKEAFLIQLIKVHFIMHALNLGCRTENTLYQIYAKIPYTAI